MNLHMVPWLRSHSVCLPHSAAAPRVSGGLASPSTQAPPHPRCTALTASLFSAPGWVPYSPAPPVHWLAGLPGHAPLQALSAQSGPPAREVAGAVRREGGTYSGPLPVSTTAGSPGPQGGGWTDTPEDAAGHKHPSPACLVTPHLHIRARQNGVDSRKYNPFMDCGCQCVALN